MRVIAWSQNLTAERAAQAGAEWVARDALFREADVLSVHLVSSERTRGLVGAAELALMKQSAFLVNTSRGPIVDEAALVAALERKAIAGAGLDVFDQEPLPAGHPLLGLDNTVLTPHLGYVTRETYEIFYRQALEDILGYLRGSPLRELAGD
jgi:phosphoglycerate dehydrogenase-like enzyme